MEHYGLSKQIAEDQLGKLLRAGAISGRMAEPWTDGGGTSFVVLRFPNSVWKGHTHELPFAKPAKPVYGGPLMWCYVLEDDVLESIVKGLLISEEDLGSKNESFNLSAPDIRIDAPTMDMVNEHWHGRTVPTLRRPLEGHASLFSNDKATRVLGIEFQSFRGADGSSKRQKT